MSELSLDDLFQQARAAMKAERRAKHEERAKKPAVEAPVEPLGLYANPDNWTRKRGLALIHRESRQLLGNFWEWRHNSVMDARRLVRSAEPIVVEGVEEVDFALSADLFPHRGSERAVVKEMRTVEVRLDTPRVSAQGVLLCVHYYNGWTAKAILVEPTTLAEGNEILQLPGGIDLLPALSRETKLALRKAPV